MTDTADCKVFISHSSKDDDFALQLAEAIERAFGPGMAWIDFFNLGAGHELAPAIAGAIQQSKWFILIASKSSVASRWVQYEANLASFLAIERDDFAILTVRIDDSVFPDPLELELRRRRYVDASKDPAEGIKQVVAALRSVKITRSKAANVFLDRGPDADRLQLAAESAAVIYLVGLPGLGKTSLVKEVARTRFSRSILSIDVRLGHDSELLARHIISKLDQAPPPGSSSTDEILGEAMSGLRKRIEQGRTLLFLDDAENSTDSRGNFRPYMRSFITDYIRSDMGFPLILACTRRPHIAVEETNASCIVVLEPMPEQFMVPCIKHWYMTGRSETKAPTDQELKPLAAQLGGYPLAAKLLASYLLFESPGSLRSKRFMASFHMQIAEYMLSNLAPMLSELETMILEATAIVATGLTVHDLMTISPAGKQYSLAEVQEAVSNLAQHLILSSEADYLRLHPFLEAFFLVQAKQHDRFEPIARDLADTAFRRTRQILNRLARLSKDPSSASADEVAQLNHQLLHNAVSAKRLLLQTGQAKKAQSLPYRLSGHIRELVLTSYRQARSEDEYREALRYAQQWLNIEPDDTEISLYLGRCYRCLGEYDKAKEILRELSRDADGILQAQIQREFGRMALAESNLTEAIEHYYAGITHKPGRRPVYPLIMVDLARALISRADERGDADPEKRKEYEEAIHLLSEARPYLPRFNHLNLGLYIDALMKVDRDAEAMVELETGLSTQPESPHLLFRKAAILMNDPSKSKEAMELAEAARDGGIDRAWTVIARLQIGGGRYKEALDSLNNFRAESERDRIYRDSQRALAMTNLGRFEEVASMLDRYAQRDNSYIAYALTHNEYMAARDLLYKDQYQQARQRARQAKKMVDDDMYRFPHHNIFLQLYRQIDALCKQIEEML